MNGPGDLSLAMRSVVLWERKYMICSLCESCASMREIVTPKRSRFLLCRLSYDDPEYPKYPPQPVVQCNGYKIRDKVEDTMKQ
jgi:hypothetical protein